MPQLLDLPNEILLRIFKIVHEDTTVNSCGPGCSASGVGGTEARRQGKRTIKGPYRSTLLTCRSIHSLVTSVRKPAVLRFCTSTCAERNAKVCSSIGTLAFSFFQVPLRLFETSSSRDGAGMARWYSLEGTGEDIQDDLQDYLWRSSVAVSVSHKDWVACSRGKGGADATALMMWTFRLDAINDTFQWTEPGK